MNILPTQPRARLQLGMIVVKQNINMIIAADINACVAILGSLLISLMIALRISFLIDGFAISDQTPSSLS